MVDNSVTLRDRLGGRWAISLRAYSWSAVPWILVGAISEPEALKSFSSFAQWLGISAIAYLVLGAVLLIADKTAFRNRRVTPVPIWLVIAVDILASEIRSISFIQLIHLTGLPDHVTPALRMLTAALMALIAFPLLTITFDSWDRYTQERNRLIEAAVNDQVNNLQQMQALEVVRLGIIKELQLRVSHSMSAARDDLTKISDASAQEHIGPDVVKIFQDISRDSIRKISHDLKEETESVSSFKFSELISTIAHSRPYRPFLIMPALFALSLTVLARNETFLLASRLTWAWTLPALAIMGLTNLYCKKFNRFEILVYGLSVIALGLLGAIPAFYFLYMDRSANEFLAWAIMGFIIGVGVIPVSGIADGISLKRQSVLESLREQVAQADIAQLALQRERNLITNEIASYMHGTVQASLSASILRLTQALATGNQSEAQLAFNQARAALELPEDLPFPQAPITLQEHLANLKSNWSGLIEIKSQVSGQEIELSEAKVLQNISTEAVNNAVRHANATHIEIEIHATDSEISFTALNDGELGQNEKLGMGLSTLSQYSSKDWSLTTTPDGKVCLTARLGR